MEESETDQVISQYMDMMHEKISAAANIPQHMLEPSEEEIEMEGSPVDILYDFVRRHIAEKEEQDKKAFDTTLDSLADL